MYGDGPWGVPGYTEVRELGSGAAGRVVLATRDYDGAEVAIKYLSDELRSDVGFVARFRHEARLLATLQSQYHARLIDYVEAGQGAAIVMELVNGVSLRELLRSEGPTGPEAALTVLKGSLLGLASAHAIGVVHRDFKPENVMVRGDGTSKLVDFGIAVRVGEDAGAAGTPPYMAPEQWSGAPAGPATDVYAATVVFFECLTGMRPFRAPNMAALARQHQSAPPPVEEVPGPLQGLVERGLAKDAAERPPSAEAFLTELEAVAAEAYGPDWEERGRRRLAALAGLLVLLFPSVLDEPAETRTSLAETRFTEPTRFLSKLPAKIAMGAVGAGVLVAAVVVILSSGSAEPVLQAQTSTVTPVTTEAATPEPVETTPEETAEPTPEETTPEATPADTDTAAPPVVQPTTTVKPTKTATPTPVKTPAKTRKPTPSRTPTPTPSPDPPMSGEAGDPAPSTTRPTTASATPTPVPVTSTPTNSSPPVTTTPTNDDTGEPGGGGQEPTVTPEDPRRGAAGALLALGLVTTGALPVTLAVRRRMAGRHRRKR
ncbi:serine/threonine-protein kinase [Nonomuraea gerenzanensis]|uniref:non-specific serine/threonine protein kinase n=1 Tax=Nonomuraea gerenzanensis TaxID=93944 RepID=A0A1M4EMZ8_9ACTN|nr:serine/threonine-protein kinase [Nonomuraea gerenzanensis]UBU11710.1 serine/threonine protein kinase [Nonomuraea gerenzanensis]SBP00210.1 serine/threonine protein kinase [Nonomuraea gerenzanensis]